MKWPLVRRWKYEIAQTAADFWRENWQKAATGNFIIHGEIETLKRRIEVQKNEIRKLRKLLPPAQRDEYDLGEIVGYPQGKEAQEAEAGGAGSYFRTAEERRAWATPMREVRAVLEERIRSSNTVDTGRLDGKTPPGGTTSR